MMAAQRCALVVAALTLPPGPPVHAQDSIAAVLARLAPGQVVRVSLDDRGRVEGRILGVERSPARLRLSGVDAPLPARAIDSLWVRGRATGHGAIIGGVIGGIGSFALAATVCEAASEGQGCDVWGTVAAIGAGGAAAGALLGAAVGAAVPRWQRRYARRAPRVGASLTLYRGMGLGVSVRF